MPRGRERYENEYSTWEERYYHSKRFQPRRIEMSEPMIHPKRRKTAESKVHSNLGGEKIGPRRGWILMRKKHELQYQQFAKQSMTLEGLCHIEGIVD